MPHTSLRPTNPVAGYRSDIDGLRAVAILSVLGFHGLPELVSGGFVGVDVFFVISGYLISSIIYREHADGRFTFRAFYARRVRRIFPALGVVLAFVLGVGWLALLSDEYRNLGAHVTAGALSAANILLWSEAGYFDVAAQLKPLLHLWSLGIEEQFYLLWPVLVALVWRRRGLLLAAATLMGLISLALGLATVETNATAAFYLPFGRWWELMLGCLLAYVQIHRSEELALGNTVAALGAGLILAAVLAFAPSDPFPGWRALFPTLGTALLIAAGPAAWINRRLLSHPIVVFVGLISYPLYLWHWPLLSFGHTLEPEHMTAAVRLALMAIAVLLAWLTYEWIEKPVRSGPRRWQVVAMPATGVATLAVVGLLVHSGVLPPRSADYGLDKIVAAESTTYFPSESLPKENWKGSGIIVVGRGSHATVIVGDSHVEHYYSRVAQLIETGALPDRRVVFIVDAGCPPLPYLRSASNPRCEQIFGTAMDYAARRDVDRVIVGGNWMLHFNAKGAKAFEIDDGTYRGPFRVGTPGQQIALAHLRTALGQLVSSGKQVSVLLQMPRSELFDPRRAIERHLPWPTFAVRPAVVGIAELRRKFHATVDPLEAVVRASGATVIDPVAALCDGTTCRAFAGDGTPIFHDAGHLNALYVRDHVRYLDTAIGAAP